VGFTVFGDFLAWQTFFLARNL